MLDEMVIQNGQFTTEGLGKMSWIESMFDEGGKTIAGVQIGSNDAAVMGGGANDRRIESAMDQVEDEEDANAAKNARMELNLLDNDFEAEMSLDKQQQQQQHDLPNEQQNHPVDAPAPELEEEEEGEEGEEEEEGGTVDDYMLKRVDDEWDYFVNL